MIEGLRRATSCPVLSQAHINVKARCRAELYDEDGPHEQRWPLAPYVLWPWCFDQGIQVRSLDVLMVAPTVHATTCLNQQCRRNAEPSS